MPFQPLTVAALLLAGAGLAMPDPSRARDLTILAQSSSEPGAVLPPSALRPREAPQPQKPAQRPREAPQAEKPASGSPPAPTNATAAPANAREHPNAVRIRYGEILKGRDLDNELAVMTQFIQAKPDLPAVYVSRGSIYRFKGDYNCSRL